MSKLINFKNLINLNLIKNINNLNNKICLRCFAVSNLPRITLPKNLEESNIDLLNKKYRQKKDKLYRHEIFIHGNKRIPIITSKFRPNLNHYYNQRYRKKSNINLASEGWKRGVKYDGDIINFMPFENNHIYKEIRTKLDDDEIDESSLVNFQSLGIRDKLYNNLKKIFNIEEPNEVQVNTIPKILSGINVRCCFETGTGKTIAYALPILERLLRTKETEQIKPINLNDEEIKEPKALIIVPSRYQISEVFKKLSSGLNLGIAPILGGKPLHLKHTGYDIVITTLGMFQSNLKKEMYSTDKIKHLIIDEVDTMCDSSFKKDISNLMNKFSFANRDNPNACQLILVSATFPEYVYNVIGDYIDLGNIDVATSEQVNHLLFHIKHTFYRINRLSRQQKLLELCYKFELDKGQTIIFVNRQPAASFIEYYLNSNDLDCVKLVKGNSDRRFHNFLDFQEGKVKFLVSTDLGSRGLDTRNVQHIINFDCPRFVTDYVHRAGRTGRMNTEFSNCSVHTFVSFKPDVYMLNQLERSIREGKEIDGIHLDIKDFYKTKYRDREPYDKDDENLGPNDFESD